MKPAASPPDQQSTPTVLLCSLREDALVEQVAGQDAVNVLTRWGEVRIDEPGPAVREALRRMAFGPVSLVNVLAGLRIEGGSAFEAQCRLLSGALNRLQGTVIQTLALTDGEGALLSVVPISGQARFAVTDIDPGRPLRLSRFATLGSGGDEAVLESPLALHRVLLHHGDALLIAAALARPTTIASLARTLGLPDQVVAAVTAHLVATGMVLAGERDRLGGTRFAEDSDPDLLAWADHDLLFHTRSRLGRHDGAYGAVFPQGHRPPYEPAVKPLPPGKRFTLPRPGAPDPAEPTLTELLESRRTPVAPGGAAVTVEQLSELLHRAARVREVHVGGQDESVCSTTDRPYPSTGDLYELELYLVIGNCSGLPRGIYHYDPQGHGLTLINTDEDALAELLDAAMIASGLRQEPPVLLTVTARFGRLSWVYGGMAYATTLKHVGVLLQTVNLVATAMRLTPQAVAFGDSDASARAFGLDWRRESSVGEMVIGPSSSGT
ncbi:SagB family peptide dehydrogenase [Kitasatospora sp. NBC_01287]|uniref:SagB/ThcOx family dehydrogenase n=1 Tax=Kitasatospora sp. NBC_01287 TaxID=2903573 RepID=UPI00225BB473|nr:SagB family peptide dehydrogenase [Kitasatospora sp. NBC_01287]MCX4748879.1 SagB family peptide dehydrogenase [Kitasatospora sp. NBC_01287]